MKKALVFATVMVVLATFLKAGSVTWGVSGQQVYQNSTTLASTGWAADLIYVGANGPDAYTGVGGTGVAGNDAIAATSSIGAGIGKTSAQPGGFVPPNFNYTYGVTTVGGQTVDNGDHFVLRVFNNASIASATAYLDIYLSGTTPYSITAVSDLSPADSFLVWSAIGKTNGGPNGWQAVPEPTSMALFGIGAGILALRRRFQKKA